MDGLPFPARKCKSHTIADRKDWKIRTLPEVVEWVEERYPDDKEIAFEIHRLVWSAQRDGFFGFSTKRVIEMYERRVYFAMRDFVENFPGVKLYRKAIPGRHCNQYTIETENQRFYEMTPEGPETVNESLSALPLPWSPLCPAYVVFDGDFVFENAETWFRVVGEQGWQLRTELFAGSGLFESLDRVFIACHTPPPEGLSGKKLEFWKRFAASCKFGSFLRLVRQKRGRMYHRFTNAPRSLRRQFLLFNGDEVGEADLHAAYWCGLVSRLAESPEKRSLVELLQSKGFYLKLEELSGTDFGDELKKQVSIQCLFWRDGTKGWQRPLWRALEKLSPQLCKMILAVRRRAGVSGLSDYLMWTESEAMYPAFREIASECGSALPLHDAALVPKSFAGRAADIVRQAAADFYGFEPAVQVK